MDPNIWGPHQWFMMHVISFTYPVKPSMYDKRAYHDYYASLKDVLPCEMCKRHYNTYFQQHPIGPQLDSRDNLMQWVVDIHNFVNKKLNKPQYTLKAVLNIYKDLEPVSPFINNKIKEDILRKETNKVKKETLIGIIVILISIILFNSYYYNKYYFTF